jgi:hypothetical protein
MSCISSSCAALSFYRVVFFFCILVCFLYVSLLSPLYDPHLSLLLLSFLSYQSSISSRYLPRPTGLRDGFRGVTFEHVPQPLRPNASVDEIQAAISDLVGAMATKGFCSTYAVTREEVDDRDRADARGGLKVSCQGTANLWGLQALRFRESRVMHAYDVLVVDAFLRASGIAASVRFQANDVGTVARWALLA